MLRPANGALFFTKLTGHGGFSLVNSSTGEHFNYRMSFTTSGTYLFSVQLDINASCCRLLSYLIVTYEQENELESSLPILISLCAGISISIIILAILFLRYRYTTKLQHNREAESIKRQQELRYLSNLHEISSASPNVSYKRRQSIREAIRERRKSTVLISEASAEGWKHFHYRVRIAKPFTITIMWCSFYYIDILFHYAYELPFS